MKNVLEILIRLLPILIQVAKEIVEIFDGDEDKAKESLQK